jgi:hypothetical protein
MPLVISPYLYWAIALSIYLGILAPFLRRNPIAMLRLVVFGITLEDFFSAMWSSIFTGGRFLPFVNWYAQYLPVYSLGEPTPYILIPVWYLLSILIYVLLTILQYRRQFAELLIARRGKRLRFKP